MRNVSFPQTVSLFGATLVMNNVPAVFGHLWPILHYVQCDQILEFGQLFKAFGSN